MTKKELLAEMREYTGPKEYATVHRDKFTRWIQEIEAICDWEEWVEVHLRPIWTALGNHAEGTSGPEIARRVEDLKAEPARLQRALTRIHQASFTNTITDLKRVIDRCEEEPT